MDVKAAYAVQTPEDNKSLYAAWAGTYDAGFAAESDYIFPQQVARVFHEQAGRGPVLDAGAGTGLVAEAIAANAACVIDAFDLSHEMLAVAETKGLYHTLIQGDLTAKLPFADNSYSAIVSAGTFTHGHVGPEALDELLRVAAPDALFVLTIKAELYEARGFAARFTGFADRIYAFQTAEVPIYGKSTQTPHAQDAGVIACFRKAS